MEERKFIVYKHENKINGKVYIGLTQNLKRRWVGKGQAYSGSPVFYKALKKYGWDNFTHEIMYENLTQEQAKQKETELIKQYKSNETAYGYNLTLGGDCNIPNEEVKNKISKTQSAGMTEERKQKIKDALKDRNFSGENNPYYGKQHTQEIRNKMSKNKWKNSDRQKFCDEISQRMSDPNSHCHKKVIRLIDGKMYYSLDECALDNNKHHACITTHCLNRVAIPEFMYKQDYDKLSQIQRKELVDTIKDRQANPSKYQYKSKGVIDLTTHEIYYSMADCVKKVHMDSRTIHKHCQKCVDAPRFMYLEEYNAYNNL